MLCSVSFLYLQLFYFLWQSTLLFAALSDLLQSKEIKSFDTLPNLYQFYINLSASVDLTDS
jgi:hypothetical protein